MIRRFGWLVLCLALPPVAAAQSPARVLGRVVDAVTGQPLSGVELMVDDRRARSGVDGGFAIAAVAPGRRALTARLIGYTPVEEMLEVLPGLDLRVTLALVPAPVRLEAIDVAASATPGERTILGEELERRGQDLATALDGWEGIAVRRTGSGGPASPQVRGSAPDEVLVLVDGVPLNDPFTGRADLTRIASGDVQRVRLVAGAQTARYGSRATAAVIVVDTRPRLRSSVSAWAGSYGALGARLGGAAGPVSMSVTASRDADAFPYDVPEVRGGGEAERVNARGTRWLLAGRIDAPVDILVRGTVSSRGLPGIVTNPTPRATAEDGAVLVSARTRGMVRAMLTGEWLRSAVRDDAPVIGTPYRVETEGWSASGELGARRA
ncbi:MAG: TonB-dependent receptor plug domain-containing protein, partial [Gemmatimonadota bacterium]